MAKRLCHEINLCSVKGAFKNHYQSYICVIKKNNMEEFGPFSTSSSSYDQHTDSRLSFMYYSCNRDNVVILF